LSERAVGQRDHASDARLGSERRARREENGGASEGMCLQERKYEPALDGLDELEIID